MNVKYGHRRAAPMIDQECPKSNLVPIDFGTCYGDETTRILVLVTPAFALRCIRFVPYNGRHRSLTGNFTKYFPFSILFYLPTLQ